MLYAIKLMGIEAKAVNLYQRIASCLRNDSERNVSTINRPLFYCAILPCPSTRCRFRIAEVVKLSP